MFHDTMTGQSIAQAYHRDIAHFEMSQKRLGNTSNLLLYKLPEKGHAQHAVCNHTIKPHIVRSLFAQVNGVVITRCLRIATKLLLRNRRFDQWSKLLTNGGV